VRQAELVRRLDAVLPRGVEALTGAELTRELEAQIQGDDDETFQQALILFAGVALVVATFSIYNTFSILVARRTRESALLRTLGASRGQVLRSVTGEALAAGLLASVGGIAAGTGLAWGLLALMDAIGLATPAAPPVLDASTVVTALVVGVAVTLLASLAPAVRASRVAPLAALRDVAVGWSATHRRDGGDRRPGGAGDPDRRGRARPGRRPPRRRRARRPAGGVARHERGAGSAQCDAQPAAHRRHRHGADDRRGGGVAVRRRRRVA
jgi:putative ABC transport system permease protein